jgi:FkbM family methyltransferase
VDTLLGFNPYGYSAGVESGDAQTGTLNVMRGLKKAFRGIINSIFALIHLEVRSVYSGGRMFPESFECLKTILPPPVSEQRYTVIDIGVAEGTPDLWRAFPAHSYKYLLVEANPLFAEKLKKTAEKMGAILAPVFCGDHDGTETFITDNARDGEKASKYSRETGGDEERSDIPSFMLDTIVKKNALTGPFIIKIDVEGAELDVLRGATETLKNAEAIIVETPVVLRTKNASTFAGIVAFLYEKGFAVFDIAEMSYQPKTGFLNLANTVFIRRNNAVWGQKSTSKS